MGLETSALVMAGIAAAAETGSAVFQVNAAHEKDEQIDLQAKQEQLRTQQKTLANYDAMEKVIDAQEAHMTTTGTAFSSPSFNAIQRNTLNIGARKQGNIDLEENIMEENAKVEKSNVQDTLYSQLFGDAASLAIQGANLAEKAPSLKPTATQ